MIEASARILVVLLCWQHSTTRTYGGEQPALPRELPQLQIESVQQKVDVFRAAWETWLAELKCKGNFVIRQQSIPVSAISVEGRSKVPLDGGQEKCQGKIVKLAEWIRVDVQYKGLPQDNGNGTVVNVPWTSITDGTRDVEYFHSPLDSKEKLFRDGVRIRHRQQNDVRSEAVFGNRGVLTPFTLGMRSLGPFDLPMPRQGAPGEVKISLVKLDDLHWLFRISRSDSNGRDYLKELTFNTESDLPLLTKHRYEVRVDGALQAGNMSVMSDFVDCAGLLAPRKLVQFLYSDASKTATARIWSSPDMGAVEPTMKDFTIAIPSDVSIRGLKVLPASDDGIRTIALSDIDDDNIFDLKSGPFPIRKIVDPDTMANENTWTAGKTAVVTVNILVIAVISLILARRWRLASG